MPMSEEQIQSLEKFKEVSAEFRKLFGNCKVSSWMDLGEMDVHLFDPAVFLSIDAPITSEVVYGTNLNLFLRKTFADTRFLYVTNGEILRGIIPDIDEGKIIEMLRGSK